jgi:hypothetical protein
MRTSRSFPGNRSRPGRATSKTHARLSCLIGSAAIRNLLREKAVQLRRKALKSSTRAAERCGLQQAQKIEKSVLEDGRGIRTQNAHRRCAFSVRRFDSIDTGAIPSVPGFWKVSESLNGRTVVHLFPAAASVQLASDLQWNRAAPPRFSPSPARRDFGSKLVAFSGDWAVLAD